MREEYLNRLSSDEIPINHPHFLVYRFYHNDLFNCLRKYAKGKLLDIGCGNKPYQKVIDPLVDEYIGCDIVQSSDRKVDVLCDATQIPFPDCYFDTVISTQTIEHVAEHQKVINEAFRVLKFEGHLIISGPMYWPIHGEPYDFFRFTNNGFRHILNTAGFNINEELANGGKWALCGQAFIHALYPEINKNQSFKWKVLRKIYKLIGGLTTINKLFLKLDREYFDNKNTMNYVFVASKCK